MEQDKIERVCQLPPLQHGVFFEALRKQGSTRMIYHAKLELTGTLRPDLLRDAWRAVLRRHTSLRSSFHYERLDTPVQVVRRAVDPPWREVDLRGAADQAAELKALLDADRAQPFDLVRAPLFRLLLVRIADDRSLLVWSLHPLLVDGWSFYLVLADVFACYEDLLAGSPTPGGALPRPHWEYVSWLRERDRGDADEFWRTRLAGVPAPGRLGDLPGEPGDADHEQAPLAITDDLAAALTTLTRTCRVTLGTVVHAAWGVVLSRYLGLPDVVFGGIVSGRDPAFEGIDDVVGVFINNQPVRMAIAPDRPVADWLAEVHHDLGDARQYDHVPLSTALRCADLPPTVPLFESMVDFCNYPVRQQWTGAAGLSVEHLELTESPPYPLALVGVGGDGGWNLFVSYEPARFSRATGEAIAALYLDVLTAMAERPQQTIGELPTWTGERPAAAPTPVAAPAPPAEPTTAIDDPFVARVAEVWAQALERPGAKLSETTQFFEAGGHSLVAVRLVSRLRADFDVDFTIVDLFTDPTVGGTARAVAALRAKQAGSGLDAIPLLPRDEPLPASFAQERLWFVDQLATGAKANNLMVAHRLAAELDVPALRAALGRLLERHEVLRTCLREQDGRVVQVVRPDLDVPVVVDDLTDLPLADAERIARERLEQDAARRFDLGAELLVTARVLRLAPGDTVLGLCLHHAVFDGWSADLLTGDLGALYTAEITGTDPELVPISVQYGDFSGWQRARSVDADVAYWRRQLAGLPDQLRLDGADPAERTGAAAMVDARLPDAVRADVHALAAQEAATPYMVLLAAYAVVLSRHCDRDDVVIGSPVADRDHPDLEPLIGLFVNTLVMRLRVAGRPTFRQLVRRVRQECLDAVAHHGLPFERLVSLVSPGRAADRMPLVQLSFTYQTGEPRPFTLAGTTADWFPTYAGVPRFELTGDVYDDDEDGLACVLHYAEDVYPADFVTALLAEYVDLVQAFAAAPDQPVSATAEASARAHDDSRALLRALSGR